MPLAVALGALVVLIGHYGGPAWLTTLGAGNVTMKVLTAASFFVAGVLVWLLTRVPWTVRERHTIIGCAFGLGVLMLLGVGGRTMPAWFAGWAVPHGFEPMTLTSEPGVPSLATLLAFVVLSLTALTDLAAHARHHRVHVAVGLFLVLTAAIALAGYVLDVPWLYFHAPGFSTAMAVHTAAFFGVLGVALMVEPKGGQP